MAVDLGDDDDEVTAIHHRLEPVRGGATGVAGMELQRVPTGKRDRLQLRFGPFNTAYDPYAHSRHLLQRFRLRCQIGNAVIANRHSRARATVLVLENGEFRGVSANSVPSQRLRKEHGCCPAAARAAGHCEMGALSLLRAGMHPSVQPHVLVYTIGGVDMRYTLRQLEVFLAVARSESVSQAAVALHMSQSAVSGALADLERQFDVRLFDRIGKRLQLSQLGLAVRARAEGVLDQAGDLERALTSHNDLGRLRVGATLTIGNYLAVALMARFLREQPGVELSLTVANTEEVARKVANFEIDVGLIEGEIEHGELDVTVWREDELTVFCGANDPLARKRVLTDEDLRRADWIVREMGSGTRQTFDRAMHGLLPELHIVLALQHTEAIKSAVAEGLGLGCLSRMVLEAEFERGTLSPCRVPHRDFRRQFFFLLHKQKYRTVGIERWLDLCRQHGG